MADCVVLGSVHMDLIATAARLPGRDESVAGGTFSMSPGGKGGNQACQLALCGINTKMLTRLGDDLFGRQLLAALGAKGVDTSLVVIDDAAATGASCVLSGAGEYSSIIASGAAANFSGVDIERARPAIEKADALVLQLELPTELSAHAARLARGMVVLNASPAPEEFTSLPRDLREKVSVLVVNRTEAGRLMRRPSTDAAELARKFSIEIVVVTAGMEGSTAHHRGETMHQPAFRVEAIDSVGAGDAYLGALIAALLEKAPLPQALQRAAAAGALAVSKRGAYEGLPTRAEIERFLTSSPALAGEEGDPSPKAMGKVRVSQSHS